MGHKNKPQHLTYRITDRASCESAIRLAVFFYFIGAAAGAIYATFDILRSGSAPKRGVAALLDVVPLLYSGLIAVLASRMHQHKSRVASTLLFALFALALLDAYLKYGIAAARGLPFQMLGGFVFFLGMRGTYLWHSTYRDAPQTPAVVSTDSGDAAGSTTEHDLEQDEHEPIARSHDDLCPKCFEYVEADEGTCRYCGAYLRPHSSAADGTSIYPARRGISSI